VTGDFKCYNTPKTCQDPPNYDNAGSEQVIRWADASGNLPVSIQAVKLIQSNGIRVRPQNVDPGESLGVRESVSVSFGNSRDNDYLFDPYPADRSENPYNRGTFWGKFFARWGNIEGYEFKIIDGEPGQAIENMRTRKYIVDSIVGPDSGGRVTITAKDPLKLLDGKKYVVPKPSQGVLNATLTDVGTSVTLVPAGVGVTYPASGTASIGDEKVTFTRSGDVMTLTGRGLSGSPQEEHDAGETFQEAEIVSSQNPGNLLFDLAYEAGGNDLVSYLSLGDWVDECVNYLGRNYSGEVMKPTPLKDLFNEVIREAGLIIWSDTSAPTKSKTWRLKVLRQDAPTVAVNDDTVIADTVKSKQLNSKRVSQMQVFFGKKNPLEEQDQTKNYTTIYTDITDDPVVALENNPPAIRQILSRWITNVNQPAAEELSDRILTRYEKVPRQVSFKMPSRFPLKAADTFTFQSRIFEDAQGDIEAPFSCIVNQIDTANGLATVSGEEVIFNAVDPGNIRDIDISTDVYNINLREVHDSIYTAPSSGDTIRLTVFDGVFIGSLSVYQYALDIGDWPAGVIIEIYGTGRIAGKGADSGEVGGHALYTRYAIDIKSNIEIWSGGGSGGSETIMGNFIAGLPGGGQIPGQDAGTGQFATTESGAKNNTSSGPGSGGDPGQDGGASKNSLNPGTVAGRAINGDSFVTETGSPDIRGYRVF
jgi:hypothetical protein